MSGHSDCSYLSSVLPPGNENLKGDEVERVIAFKNAIGMEDADAAPVHIEVSHWCFVTRHSRPLVCDVIREVQSVCWGWFNREQCLRSLFPKASTATRLQYVELYVGCFGLHSEASDEDCRKRTL